jgi:uncharacterized damage-inducible protein DinB
MNATPLEKLFEHNHWANLKTLMACAALSDEQLDAAPLSATKGTIRITLTHLIASQQGYLELLTLPVEQRRPRGPVPYDTLEASARASGEALLALVGNLPEHFFEKRLQTTDGYSVEPWVVLVQAINHAAEHREQINNMLSALGVTPPNLDGWAYGEATQALTPLAEKTENSQAEE